MAGKWRELERLAVMAAIEAPERRSRYSSGARIRWETVEAIRAELERVGVDWRPMVRRRVELERERGKRAAAERAAAFRAAHPAPSEGRGQ